MRQTKPQVAPTPGTVTAPLVVPLLREENDLHHESFNQAGIPGFQFIQDPRDDETLSLHSNQDVYERLSADDLKQAAVVEAIFVYNTAMRDAMLPRNALPRPQDREQQSKPLSGLFPEAEATPKQ